ncbi:MAG: phenylalanine--tRNA ligase subunit beta, partial [Candidatus Spechtbacterales bacterium]|nr:phenylalanine--tRNA ligase subunit beta [Candidatus Spechtbacterales bacterium]
ASVINGVDVKESPKWLKKILASLGLNSINNIVDVANYAMLVTGQPLHVFDLDKIEGNKIIVRRAKKGEAIKTLDGEAYVLDDNMLVIADTKDPLAIAGIKGGTKAEVSGETKNILIESANFEPVGIRKTSQALGLRTDASWRFEHEVPLVLVPSGLNKAVEIITDIAEGKIQDTIVDTFKQSIEKRVIGIRPHRAGRLLGLELTGQKISSILNSLEFSVQKEQEDMLQVQVPPFRLDIEREADLIEEVGRIVGYENTEPKMPNAALYPPGRNVKNYWMRQVRRHLAASGFNEVYNYSFVSEHVLDLWKFDGKNIWELKNPVSNDLKFMRPSLLPGLLKTVKENLKHQDTVSIFEAGEVFQKESPQENSRLALALSAKKEGQSGFYALKGEIEHLFHVLGLSDIWFDDAIQDYQYKELSFMHPKRTAIIKTGDKGIGFMGQIHPGIAGDEKLKHSLFVSDIDLSALIEEAEEEEIYTPISEYPQVVRDIAVVIPVGTKADEIITEINSAAGELLRDVDMFDYYEEIENPESKSMAFHLVFQAEDRTLESKEIDDIMSKITHVLEQHSGWSVR